ncbi:hypothetical protein [Marivita sp.]|uniref:hypothetical protein n=1 Tax=Marivita sp. TaxID=2003365 RepID=UPI00261A6F12|nr:hypothetical protein [Marivita sp.]
MAQMFVFFREKYHPSDDEKHQRAAEDADEVGLQNADHLLFERISASDQLVRTPAARENEDDVFGKRIGAKLPGAQGGKHKRETRHREKKLPQFGPRGL